MCLIVENDIDLILLDIEMPELNGIELLKSLKAKDPSIPIIMITGYPSVDNIVQSMKLGASHVFVKPSNFVPCAFKIPAMDRCAEALSFFPRSHPNGQRTGTEPEEVW